jgi:hypothetical protein
MQRKLLGIFCVDFDTTGELLIIYSAFVKYLRKNGNTKMCLNEPYGTVWVSKHMSDTSHIKNGLKQGHASSQLVFNLA